MQDKYNRFDEKNKSFTDYAMDSIGNNEEALQGRSLLDEPVFNKFFNPGEIVEVRIIRVHGKNPAWGNQYANGPVSGYYDNHAAFLEAVLMADKAQHAGIYFTLQT